MYSESFLIQENFNLQQYNTFGISANTDYFVKIDNTNSLSELIKSNFLTDKKYLVLGGGSNILLSEDFCGVILKNNIRGIEVLEEEEKTVKVRCGGGEDWDEFVKYCVDKEYYGIENLSLIPGTVGASPIQNIGAYGVEVKDVIESVSFTNLINGDKKTFLNKECEFGYRDSIFKKEMKREIFITSVVFSLSKCYKPVTHYPALDSEIVKRGITKITAKQLRQIVIDIRRSKLPEPDELGNAGSFFKNPVVSKEKIEVIKNDYPNIKCFKNIDGTYKVPAAWLIDNAGLKGKTVGNTGTHKDQPLVVVNYGGATGSDIINFARFIQKEVKEKFGIELIPEVNII